MNFGVSAPTNATGRASLPACCRPAHGGAVAADVRFLAHLRDRRTPRSATCRKCRRTPNNKVLGGARRRDAMDAKAATCSTARIRMRARGRWGWVRARARPASPASCRCKGRASGADVSPGQGARRSLDAKITEGIVKLMLSARAARSSAAAEPVEAHKSCATDSSGSSSSSHQSRCWQDNQAAIGHSSTVALASAAAAARQPRRRRQARVGRARRRPRIPATGPAPSRSTARAQPNRSSSSTGTCATRSSAPATSSCRRSSRRVSSISSTKWSGHEPAALRAGVEQSVIDVVKFNRAISGLSEKDATVIRLGRALLRDHKVSSELWAKTVELFGRQGAMRSWRRWATT